MSFAKAVDLLRLARMAIGSVGITLDEIEAEFGCVRRTAQRMTQALIRVFPDTEDYIDPDGAKRWRVPRRRVAGFFAPTAEQIAALELATESLEQQAAAAEAKQLRMLRDTIKILTNDRTRLRLEADGEALLEAMGHAARPGPRPVTDPEVDAAISKALKGPFVLDILYRSRAEDEASWRRVEPHGLLLGARRYLVAYDSGRDDKRLRHYRVEDIKSARLTEDSFNLDPDFDLGVHASRAFGVFQDEAEYGEVVWKFSPKAASHAARFRFHPGQEIEELEDGSLVVRFKACGHLEMCWHLYTWGDQVEVLAPRGLVDIVAGFRRSDFPALP